MVMNFLGRTALRFPWVFGCLFFVKTIFSSLIERNDFK
jgi:hypothetical protein